MPLVFMNKILSLTESRTDSRPMENSPSKSAVPPTIFNIVVLTGEGDPFGLVIDEIRDTADIVVKPLPQFLKRLNLFSGATIMGDGTVSLILDVSGMAEKANIQKTTSKKEALDHSAHHATKAVHSESQEYLFFTLNNDARYCIPLILVHRLEEFPRSQVEESNRERIVKYRNSILPLIDLNPFFKIAPKTSQTLSEKISVIVVSKRRRLFGIEVNQIFDVLNLEGEIESPIVDTNGILGNILSGDHIASVIDVLGIIDSVMGQTHATVPGSLPETHRMSFRKPMRILFAEDTPFFVKHVKKILNDLNIEVIHAEDGEAALKILRSSNIDNFDLVLSDIEMPNMNGFELAENIRKDKIWGQIPMIALTTRFKELDIKKGLNSGFNQYLEKLSADQLIDAVKNQLGGLVA